MKRFGEFYPALDPAEIGAGTGNLYDGKIFDIGFHHLGFMRSECRNFFFEGIGNIHKYVRFEILGCRSFVK